MMKKTTAMVFLLTLALSLAGCGAQSAGTAEETEVTEETTSETKTEEETEEEAEDTFENVDWDRSLLADLGEIVSGFDDMTFTAGEGTRSEIRNALWYDEEMVRMIMVNTDDVKLTEPGTYEMEYMICFNREPLLEWMEANGVDSTLYPGMDSDADALIVTTPATVTVTEAD